MLTMTTKPKRGRPSTGRQPEPARSIRVSDADWHNWKRVAAAAGKTVSEWLRELASLAVSLSTKGEAKMTTTKINMADLSTEAAIYAEGTDYSRDDLVRLYLEHVAACEAEGREPKYCQRFFGEDLGIN